MVIELETINEENTTVVTVAFYDEEGSAAVPVQAWYSLYCETTGTEILIETEIVSLDASIEIEVTPAQNAILDGDNEVETKLMTVKWTYGEAGAKQGSAEYRWNVRNLARI